MASLSTHYLFQIVSFLFFSFPIQIKSEHVTISSKNFDEDPIECQERKREMMKVEDLLVQMA